MREIVLVDTFFWSQAQQRLESFYDVALIQEALDTWTDERKRRVVGLLVFQHYQVDKAVARHFPNLKIVSNYGVGINHIRHEDMDALKVKVSNTPDVVSGSTADLALGLLLSASRRICWFNQQMRVQSAHSIVREASQEVHGSTVGIIGLGRIGKEIARRCRGFDLKVLYYQRRRHSESIEKEFNVEFETMEGLLHNSDYVIIACPLTPDTHHLLSIKQFERMKPSAYLINIARGPIVQTNDLIIALERKLIQGAALDVTDPEPLPLGHRLLEFDNIIVLPHVGTLTDRTREDMFSFALSNLKRGIKGYPQVPEMEEMVKDVNCFSMKVKQPFIAWNGVLAIVYEGFPSQVVKLKQKIIQSYPNLPQENFGSKWPKTSVAALKKGVQLSLEDLRRLNVILEGLDCQDLTVRVEELSFVLYRCKSTEKRVFQANYPLLQCNGETTVDETQKEMVNKVIAESDCADTYIHKVQLPGHDAMHYTELDESTTLVCPISDESFIAFTLLLKAKVSKEFPNTFQWFNPTSYHITIRALE